MKVFECDICGKRIANGIYYEFIVEKMQLDHSVEICKNVSNGVFHLCEKCFKKMNTGRMVLDDID